MAWAQERVSKVPELYPERDLKAPLPLDGRENLAAKRGYDLLYYAKYSPFHIERESTTGSDKVFKIVRYSDRFSLESQKADLFSVIDVNNGYFPSELISENPPRRRALKKRKVSKKSSKSNEDKEDGEEKDEDKNKEGSDEEEGSERDGSEVGEEEDDDYTQFYQDVEDGDDKIDAEDNDEPTF